MRHRKTDAHIATIRVSVPIDLMRLSTVSEAAEAINGIQAHLPPGSTVEVLNSRFGRVDAPRDTKVFDGIMAGLNDALAHASGGDDGGGVNPQPTQLDIEHALAAVRDQVTAGAMPDDESLRRVPRPAPNGGG